MNSENTEKYHFHSNSIIISQYPTSKLIIKIVVNPWMSGIRKRGMAQIWSCGLALRNYKKEYINLTFGRPGLKNQKWRGLETPIHNWSLRPSLQLMI